MRAVLLFASLVGAVVFLHAMSVATSDPEGYHDRISASFSPDQQRVLWYNHQTKKLSLFDLESQQLSAAMDIQLRHLEWAKDGKTILGIQHDDELTRYRFAKIDPDKQTVSKGPPASFFAQTPDGRTLLFGRGDYMDDTGITEVHRADSTSAGETRFLSENFHGPHGDFSMAKLSPEGDRLAVSAWSYNYLDRLEVYQLSDWSRVCSSDITARFAFFVADNQLLVVENDAGMIALHRFDLATDTRLISRSNTFGWCEAAALSPDGKILVLGVQRSESESHLELFSADGIRWRNRINFPGARVVIDLAFAPDGKNLHAISRSGGLWTTGLGTETPREVFRFFPEKSDSRWVSVWIGLALYALFWISLLIIRKRSRESENAWPLYQPGKYWVLGIIVFEICYLVLNLSVAISQGGIFLSGVHVVLAAAAILFYVSAALLSMRANYVVGFVFTAILGLGAWFGFFIVSAAIASV